MKIIDVNTNEIFKLSKVEGKKIPSFVYWSQYQSVTLVGNTEGTSFTCPISTNPHKLSNYVYIQIGDDHYYFRAPNLASSLGCGVSWKPLLKIIETSKPRSIKPRVAKPKTRKSQVAKKVRCEGFSPDLYDSDLARSERNDCVVRAVMECLGVYYDEAHKLVQPYRAGKGKGTWTIKLMNDPYFKARFNRMQVFTRRMTVAQFLREHPKGRFIVTVNRHGFAVINGVVKDFTLRPRQRVASAYQLIGEK